MADVQLENGFTRVANEILEEVTQRKFNATQLSVLMIVWRNTYGYNRKDHELAIGYFVQATGYTKRNIQDAVNYLIESNVLSETKKATFNQSRKIAFNKNHDEWKVTSRIKEQQVKNRSPHEEKNTSTGEESFTPTGEEKNTSTGEESFTHKRKIKDNIKENIKEKKSSGRVEEIISFWDENGFGYNNINAKNQLLTYLDEGIEADLVLEALKIACSKNARHIKFIQGVFRNWIDAGIKNVEQLKLNDKPKKQSIFSQGEESKKRQSSIKPLTPEQQEQMEQWEEELPF
jgi:phage replication O-like protein O